MERWGEDREWDFLCERLSLYYQATGKWQPEVDFFLCIFSLILELCPGSFSLSLPLPISPSPILSLSSSHLLFSFLSLSLSPPLSIIHQHLSSSLSFCLPLSLTVSPSKLGLSLFHKTTRSQWHEIGLPSHFCVCRSLACLGFSFSVTLHCCRTSL